MSVQKAVVLDVKVEAVAINPTDWKSIARTNVAGALGGVDFAGVVEQTGDGYEKPWKVGDRIAGFAFGNNPRQHDDGAFAEHIVVRADLALRIPDSMAFEAAATLGVGFVTCGQGLFSHQGLKLDSPGNPSEQGEQLFIYGGSTATAAMGIQLAKLAGYTVFTVCSSDHFDFVKSLGAAEAFDYKDPQSVTQIKAAAGGGFKYVWDTISSPSSADYCMKLMLPHGNYRNLGPVPISRDDVSVGWTYAYTALGEPVKKGDVLVNVDASEDYEEGKKFVPVFEKLLLDGKIKIHPHSVSADGLDGVLSGLALLADNKVRGQKLVYTL